MKCSRIARRRDRTRAGIDQRDSLSSLASSAALIHAHIHIRWISLVLHPSIIHVRVGRREEGCVCAPSINLFPGRAGERWRKWGRSSSLCNVCIRTRAHPLVHSCPHNKNVKSVNLCVVADPLRLAYHSNAACSSSYTSTHSPRRTAGS